MGHRSVDAAAPWAPRALGLVAAAVLLAACPGCLGNNAASGPIGTPPGSDPAATAKLPLYTDGTDRLNALLGQALEVLVPPGIYIITGELKVRDGQSVAAAPGAEVILRPAAGYRGAVLSVHGERLTLRKLTFDGNQAQRPELDGKPEAALVKVEGPCDLLIADNRFLNAPSFAVWSAHASGIQLDGNRFIDCYHAIRLDGNGMYSGRIENNRFENSARVPSLQHITATHTSGLSIRGNLMGGAGLREPARHGYDGTWGNSIYIYDSTGYLIENNHVGRNRWSSLVSGENGRYATIRGNHFSDGAATPTAMWVEQSGAGYVSIENNELDGALSLGDSGGDHVVITGNTIRSRAVGIDVSFGAKHVLIERNSISSKAANRDHDGIYLWEKKTPDVDVRVHDNTIEGFARGIAINNSHGVGQVYGIELRGNSFARNRLDVWVAPALRLAHPLGQP